MGIYDREYMRERTGPLSVGRPRAAPEPPSRLTFWQRARFALWRLWRRLRGRPA
ncbi:MAG: hypothetical protein K9N49_05150 [Candidatus Marinimicrobia bacterium]|nr:hypothetical protein [Candidatus Neomarinimicrobiota bacterium]